MEPEFGGTFGPDTMITGFSVLYGRAGDDVLAATELGPAYIEGGQGDDVIFAEGGATTADLDGGAGDDVVVGFKFADDLDGGSGDDVVIGGDFVIPAGATGPVTPDGPSGTDHLEGGSGVDAVYGFDGNDEIHGGPGDDFGSVFTDFGEVTGKQVDAGLFGGAGDDYVDGGSGNDWISGGVGKDTLAGGIGSDWFLFDAPLIKANVDTILDFKEDDVFVLDPNVFTEIGEPGFFPAKAFQEGKTAKNKKARILYDDNSGKVFYDPDGSKKEHKVLFAKIDEGLKLDFANFSMDI